MKGSAIADWFERAGLLAVSIEHHNAKSWRGAGRVPKRAVEE
jgi:hypothetical protein